MRAFPLGCAPRSAGLKTAIRISISPISAISSISAVLPRPSADDADADALRHAVVTSTSKPSYPPVWLVASAPLRYTAACQLTAPKRSIMREPCFAGRGCKTSR